MTSPKSESSAAPPQEGIEISAAPASAPASAPEGAKPGKADAGATWPLEAERMALHYPQIECLRLMAGHFGRRASTQALIAGLPLGKAGVTPQLFTRAAERADLSARLAERSLPALAIAPILPCVLVLGGGQACILWDIKWPQKNPPKKDPGQKADAHPETSFIVEFPETEGQRQTLSLAALNALYSGYVFFIAPVARTDDRVGPAEIDSARDWFWGTLKKSRRIYQEVVLAAVMINVFALASPLYVMNVYDRVVPNSAWATLWVLSAGVMIVYLFDFLIKGLRAHFLDIAGRKADIKISAQLFEQMLGMTMTARPASAGVLASNMREFEGLRDFFTSATMVALIDLPFTLLFIAIVAMIGGPIALIPLVAVPVVILMGYVLQRPLQKITRESLNESALKNALLFETISGLETIKVQAAEGNMQRRWEELTVKSSGTAVKMRRLSAFALNMSGFIQQAVSVFVVILGVWLITEGHISMGALIACVMLSGRAMAPLTQVAGLLTRMNQSRESLRQLDEMMKKPVERPAGKHFIPMPVLDGRVEFRDLVFHYPGQSVPALKNISFSVARGERVGIIGAVGSGKTTLERLLLNLYQPDSGSVQIDGADVRQIDPGDLRRAVGAVQQSPNLFYGTVRENITMGHEMASERSVLRAAELSGVMEFLRDSQHGLDTQVGERGEALSGGQRQAVAIARALLYDPPILIMDEPTASMDPASENRLLKRLSQICFNKTTILITHKGSMLGLVDKLILMDRGKLVDFGPKDEIIRKLQARHYGSSAEQTDI